MGRKGKGAGTMVGMNRRERAAYGPRILAERTRLGMSQEQLAKAAGVSGRTIGNIERGDTAANREQLDRILRALGLSPTRINGAADDELATLIAVVKPFLATLNAEHRAAVMPRLVEALVREMRQQITEELSSDS